MSTDMDIRLLPRERILSIWQMDRSEHIRGVYHLVEGELELRPEEHRLTGWPAGEPEKYAPIVFDCFDRGGTCFGAFAGEELVGVSVLESRFIGGKKDRLQLKLLNVSQRCRKQGLGKRLFLLAAEKARQMGAQAMYISATPSENTINFYRSLGCEPAGEVDAELFALEPEDIHLEYPLGE